MKRCSEMTFHYAVGLRIYPNKRQRRIIAKNDGVSRKTYNNLVSYNEELFRLYKVPIYSEPIQKRIEFLREILDSKGNMLVMMPFVKDEEIDSLAIDNAYVDYRSAWNQFRKVPGTQKPCFHRKSYEQRYKTNAHLSKGARNWDDSNVYFYPYGKRGPQFINLPILGKTRFKGSSVLIQRILNHRKDTRIGSISVRRDNCGDYFISLQFHSDLPFIERLPNTGAMIGIDMNLSNFYTDSDGNIAANPKYRRNIQKDLSKSQRILSRRQARAKEEKRNIYQARNYQKQRLKVARLQRLQARQRDDFLNVESKRLVENQDLIVSEDLKVKNLLRNHKLAYAISDVSWSAFFTMLGQKSSMYGKTYLKVPPHYTTQTCSECGHVMKEEDHIALGISEWDCPVCKTHHIRDYNAAKNILNRGIEMLYSA